jgi:Protein of unknown function (DUF1580).
MIDLDREELLSISAAARQCPGRPHVATVWRWAETGVKGIRLETVQVGGRRFTSAEAIRRFIERTTAAAVGPAAEPPRTPAARQRAIAAAKAELAKAGI